MAIKDMTLATCATKDDVLYVRTPVHEMPARPTFGTICHPKNRTPEEARVFGLALAYPNISLIPHKQLVRQVAHDLECLFLVSTKTERQLSRAWAWLLGKELAHHVFVSSNGTGDAPAVMRGAMSGSVCTPWKSPVNQMRQGATLKGCHLGTSHEAERTFWTLIKVWHRARQGNNAAHYTTDIGAAAEAEGRLVADISRVRPELAATVHDACKAIRGAASRSHIDVVKAWRDTVQATLVAYADVIDATTN